MNQLDLTDQVKAARARIRRRAELWNGYRSYQWLLPGDDLRTFDFVPAIGREPRASMTWDDSIEERALAFTENHLVVSAHDHLSLRPERPEEFAEYRRQGRETLPYEGISVSQVDLFFDGGPAIVSQIRSHAPWDWDDAVSDIGMRQSDIDHQDLLTTVRTKADLASLRGSDRVGVVMTLEAATMIGNDVDRLDILYGLGVRQMGLIYSESNQLGGGLGERCDPGLTELGRRALKRMNDIGIIVDISHAGDRSGMDAVNLSTKPVVITHAGARALWDVPRLKSDDLIRAVAGTGGFIGIEAAPNTTEVEEFPQHGIESVMRHVEYCIELVGIEHVALGPDTNFCDHLAWHRWFFPPSESEVTALEHLTPRERIEFVYGLENPAEAMRNMIRWLFAHGYSDDEVSRLAGQNVLRVVDDTWAR